ncbi:MAG: hypothetical protein AAB512_03935 [Patescibacteria group bacterium]
MKLKKYRKQLRHEIKDLKAQFKRLTYVSIALAVVLTGAAIASTCGTGANFV